MSKRSILVLVASLAIFGATSAFANTLDVNADAAIDGDFGLEMLVQGPGDSTFVADQSPTDESVYRIEFRANPNDILMDDRTGHAIFMGRMSGGEGNIIRLFMRYTADNDTYKLVCRWKRDIGGTGFCGQFTFAPNNTRIGVEWVKASGPGNNDGIIRLRKGNNVQFEKTNAGNSNFDIDTARLGLPQGTVPTSSGSFYLDSFSSFRTLAP